MKGNDSSTKNRNRQHGAIMGGGLGSFVGIILAAMGCALYRLPWDVMLLFAGLYGALSGAMLGFLLDTLSSDN